ncbi:MAG: response regulator transcription factor [Verrucomicrobiae bacterium]|nr:response regulator transcription factor [Verrucomicrobiae bacterium]
MKKKILVVEDQAPMRRNIALMLEMEGFEVETADNGLSGIEIAQRVMPDLVICDVMMPGVDGYGVVQALRGDDKFTNIPFIFLTAKSDRADVRIGMNFGADDYLTKPVVRDDLLAAVTARLARAESVQGRIDEASTGVGFNPDFSSHEPLIHALGVTPREAEVLLWVAQGKSNGDVALILGMSEKTVKQHMSNIFTKLGLENRNAAAMRAVEVLNGPDCRRH